MKILVNSRFDPIKIYEIGKTKFIIQGGKIYYIRKSIRHKGYYKVLGIKNTYFYSEI